ncbi:hypothetical protein ASPCAL07874 [Aspergillus calidoustus]|uniref:Uncharacterized protein n=1 Tax=Aspergillus calidoustus TaxID=454130 RepID=A0A0U5GRT4_ASPCI|nr:hypothetical protein ASPCAL07874 [Aspergillus calidoustus]
MLYLASPGKHQTDIGSVVFLAHDRIELRKGPQASSDPFFGYGISNFPRDSQGKAHPKGPKKPLRCIFDRLANLISEMSNHESVFTGVTACSQNLMDENHIGVVTAVYGGAVNVGIPEHNRINGIACG